MTEENEIVTLAKAAFWVTDAVKGIIGTWTVEENGWGTGDLPRAMEEFRLCMRTLREAGFKDKPKIAERAPYTHNVSVGCFFKKIEDVGDRWVTVRLTTRFGLNAEFEVHEKEPWSN